MRLVGPPSFSPRSIRPTRSDGFPHRDTRSPPEPAQVVRCDAVDAAALGRSNFGGRHLGTRQCTARRPGRHSRTHGARPLLRTSLLTLPLFPRKSALTLTATAPAARSALPLGLARPRRQRRARVPLLRDLFRAALDARPRAGGRASAAGPAPAEAVGDEWELVLCCEWRCRGGPACERERAHNRRRGRDERFWWRCGGREGGRRQGAACGG